MGLFYEHVTLFGASQTALADYMKESGRQGYVSPTVDGVTVVYDKASAGNVSLIFELASELSTSFNCAVFAIHIHDSDVMFYRLFRDGVLLDEYNSQPDYFGGHAESSLPLGDAAARLCSAFGKPEITEQAAMILHHDVGDTRNFWLAEERHEKLAQALGWPSFVPYIGYNFIAEDGFGEGFDSSAFVTVGL